jgi:shikimate kinase
MVCLLNDLFDEDHEDHVSREELASRYSCSVIQASSFALDLMDEVNIDFRKYEYVLPEYRLSKEEYENQTNIFLLGTGNVGKTTTAKMLAEKLGFDFYDLGPEMKKFHAMTFDELNSAYAGWNQDPLDHRRGQILGRIVSKPGKKVIAVSPMYYSTYFTKYTRLPGAVPIVLEDSPEHIFGRLVFADENDVVYQDDAYKNRYRRHYLSEISKDQTYYRKSFEKVENHFNMNGDAPESVVERLITEYDLQSAADSEPDEN